MSGSIKFSLKKPSSNCFYHHGQTSHKAFAALVHVDCLCVAESPLQFYVNHVSSPSVTACGPGLSYGVANKLATFTVYTEDASEGTGREDL